MDILTPLRQFFEQLGNLITDPVGTVTYFACQFITFIFGFFPSTPEALTLQGLANKLGNALPFVGSSIIYSILRDFSLILGLALIVKIYKLIPFKMS